MSRSSRRVLALLAAAAMLSAAIFAAVHSAAAHDGPHAHGEGKVEFSIRSVGNGNWSNAKTWKPARVPRAGDRVLIERGTRVVYDAASDDVIRLLQVVGTLTFSRDRDTLLNVAVLKVQNSLECSESGFACDFAHVNEAGEPHAMPEGDMPVLEIGTPEAPIPAEHTARIRLHWLEGMSKDDAPAIACCSARMDIHGAPLSRTWLKLGRNAEAGDETVTLAEEVTGWKVGDEVILTDSTQSYGSRRSGTEERTITAIEGTTVTLDEPLVYEHSGEGEFRSEIANLSRNVVIESADPKGVRGHTVYHWGSRGGISYARFAHLGKRGVLGRYPIHFHLVDDTMRGSAVVGVSVVDSHNRWVTIHGTNYMVIRDCVGYKSLGHGYFMEDGTEVYNVLDRNLGVQATSSRPLPQQVLAWDPNDGAGFWWPNARNTLIRNVACENGQYGFRYDSQPVRRNAPDPGILMPDGSTQVVEIRSLPMFRFEDNESHGDGLYAMRFSTSNRAAPDTRHPHVLRNVKVWNTNYGIRAEIPSALFENVQFDHTNYGVYHPAFENQVYRNLVMTNIGTEPFNRGYDDQSTQYGSIAVDGLTFHAGRSGGIPMIQMSDNNPTGKAESHFRNVVVHRPEGNRRVLVGRGGGAQVTPKTSTSVPVYLHDFYGTGRTAKVVSTAARDFRRGDDRYSEDAPVTGRDSLVAEVENVEFPQLLDPVDDLPPATIITSPAPGSPVKAENGVVVVRGVTTDNERTARVVVNGAEASDIDYGFHVWEARLTGVKPGKLTLTAFGEDAAGNKEQMPHAVTVLVE
ncbi:MAG: G8 domain-containing protein [Planctomycetaceae bacterium]